MLRFNLHRPCTYGFCHIFVTPFLFLQDNLLCCQLSVHYASFVSGEKEQEGRLSFLSPIADVPYLGLVGWSVPIKVATLPEESDQEIQPYSPIMQQNSTPPVSIMTGQQVCYEQNSFLIHGDFGGFLFIVCIAISKKLDNFQIFSSCLTLILHWVSADPAGFRYCPPPIPMHWLPVNSRDIADIQRLNSRDSSLDCSLMNPRRDLSPKHCSLCGKVCLFCVQKK